MFVFRYGNIYEYDEKFADNTWTYEELLIASSFFASCVYRNIDKEKAYSLSSMYVLKNKVLYGRSSKEPELQYPEIYEKDIENCLRIFGK